MVCLGETLLVMVAKTAGPAPRRAGLRFSLSATSAMLLRPWVFAGQRDALWFPRLRGPSLLQSRTPGVATLVG